MVTIESDSQQADNRTGVVTATNTAGTATQAFYIRGMAAGDAAAGDTRYLYIDRLGRALTQAGHAEVSAPLAG